MNTWPKGPEFDNPQSRPEFSWFWSLPVSCFQMISPIPATIHFPHYTSLYLLITNTSFHKFVLMDSLWEVGQYLTVIERGWAFKNITVPANWLTIDIHVLHFLPCVAAFPRQDRAQHLGPNRPLDHIFAPSSRPRRIPLHIRYNIRPPWLLENTSKVRILCNFRCFSCFSPTEWINFACSRGDPAKCTSVPRDPEVSEENIVSDQNK